MKETATEVNMRSTVLTCDAQYNEKRAFLNLDTNDTFEISLVTAGTGIHRVLDKDIPCKAGDMFIVPAGVPHGYFADTADNLILRQLFFDVDDWFSGDVVNRASLRYCYGAFRESPTLSYAALNARTAEKIGGIWDLIEQELAARKDEWRDAVGNLLSYLMITIARYINASIKNLSFASFDEWNTVTSAIRIVREEYKNAALTLEEVAARLYVSKSQFGRTFRKLTGAFFADYLRDVRLKNACKRLRNSDATVEDIAKECGFQNMPTFYKHFGAQQGLTPREYRRVCVEDDPRSEDYIKLLKGEKVMSILNDVSENLQKGRSKVVKELVQQALDEGVKPADILEQGLLAGMSVIGEKFKNNEIYVPEVLVAARAMSMGSQVLKPYLMQEGVVSLGKVCIGTVQGDLHDIGKNLVKMMMEGKGFEVIDLGTDVAPETFVQTAIEQDCQIICCSALLTTTMEEMAKVVDAAKAAGVRDKVKIMIGGAPVSQEYCDKIGADCYTVDAASAADAAVKLVKGA